MKYFIEYAAYTSKLKNKDTRGKALFALILLLCGILGNNIFSLSFIFLVSIYFTVVKSGTPIIKYIKMYISPALFIFMGIIAVSANIYSERTGIICLPFFADKFICTTESSIHRGILTGLRAFSCISSMYFLILTTDIYSITALFTKLKFPQIITELMFLIYRFIFVLTERRDAIIISQKSRLGYENFKLSIKSLAMMFSSVFIISMTKVSKIYDSLESRCFDGKFIFSDTKYNKKDFMYFILVSIIVLTIFIFMEVNLKWKT